MSIFPFGVWRSHITWLMPADMTSSHINLTHALCTPERPTFLYFPDHTIFFHTYISSHMLFLLSGVFFLASSGYLNLFILHNKLKFHIVSEPSPHKNYFEIHFKTLFRWVCGNMRKQECKLIRIISRILLIIIKIMSSCKNWLYIHIIYMNKYILS